MPPKNSTAMSYRMASRPGPYSAADMASETVVSPLMRIRLKEAADNKDQGIVFVDGEPMAFDGKLMLYSTSKPETRTLFKQYFDLFTSQQVIVLFRGALFPGATMVVAWGPNARELADAAELSN
jgi:hypothetical protein